MDYLRKSLHALWTFLLIPPARSPPARLPVRSLYRLKEILCYPHRRLSRTLSLKHILHRWPPVVSPKSEFIAMKFDRLWKALNFDSTQGIDINANSNLQWMLRIVVCSFWSIRQEFDLQYTQYIHRSHKTCLNDHYRTSTSLRLGLHSPFWDAVHRQGLQTTTSNIRPWHSIMNTALRKILLARMKSPT
jgi:hypothetical protein